MKYLVLFVSLLIFSGSVGAKVTVVSSLFEQIDVSNGQRVNRSFMVQNLGSEAAEVKIYLEDDNRMGSDKHHPRTNKQWIKLSSSKLLLGPGEERAVPYQVRIPNSRLRGSYWSRIIVEPIKKQSKESTLKNNKESFTVTIRSVTRYAISVLTHFDEGAAKYSFSAPKIEKDAQGQRVLKVNIHNSGSRHSYVDTRLDVFNKSGKPVAAVSVDRTSMYPNTKKRISIPLNRLQVGSYKSLLSLDDTHSGQAFGTDVNLTILP